MNPQDFALTYQKSPIILTNGIAANVPGGMLPIISITQSDDFTNGILSGADNLDLNDFFADFMVLPGGTLVENDIGRYPFANQAVAANAIIAQPLKVSLRMITPVRKSSGGVDGKLSTFQSLQSALQQHNASGGTYTVATPAFLYTDLIMRSFRDASDGSQAIPQNMWVIDFEKPLLTLADAQAAQNSLMQKISNGNQVTPDANGNISYSGKSPAVGVPPSGQAPSNVPASQGLGGASASSPSQPPQ